jgi:EpsI family protein
MPNEMSRAIFFLLAMCLIALAAHRLTPTHLMSSRFEPLNLGTAVPDHFAEWAQDPSEKALVIDPLTSEAVKAVYSQTISRTYVNSQGARIMLSVAYGEDQRQNKVHVPQGCYAGQGFAIKNLPDGAISLKRGTLPIHRFEAVLGYLRQESVTYWIVYGGKVATNSLGGRATLFELELSGQIPDGAVIRVSSIGNNIGEQYKEQERFLVDFYPALTIDTQRHLFGF